MFSSSVGRVVRPTAAASTACNASTAASSVRSVAAVSHRGHQRRPSSSKTSVPPDNAKRVAIEQGKQKNADGGRGTRKSRVRTARGSGAASDKKAAFVPLGKLYPDMPEPVRNTNHLKREDLAVMQLFAGHLPISPNHIVPQPVSDAQFDALFQPKPHWQKYKETLDQLNGAIAGLEESGVVDGAEDAVEIVHLDAADSVADPLSHYYRMNRPPPPPRPIEDIEQERASVPRKRSRKGKSWQTTITVTEWTDGQGHRTFRADSTPIVRVPRTQNRVIEEPMPTQSVSIRQPFLERMRVRQQKWQAAQAIKIKSPVKKPRMLLISVKRQRKAKMKKHKLKKLRKRTRNLRRKLGKL